MVHETTWHQHLATHLRTCLPGWAKWRRNESALTGAPRHKASHGTRAPQVSQTPQLFLCLDGQYGQALGMCQSPCFLVSLSMFLGAFLSSRLPASASDSRLGLFLRNISCKNRLVVPSARATLLLITTILRSFLEPKRVLGIGPVRGDAAIQRYTTTRTRYLSSTYSRVGQQSKRWHTRKKDSRQMAWATDRRSGAPARAWKYYADLC